jgi:hypothetical protein
LEEVWQISEYARNIKNLDIIWDMFARILSIKGHKPNPLHIDVLKHIVSIALGDVVGIKAAGASEIAAPAMGFQQVLIDNYYLKQYVPTIMHLVL